MPAKKNKKGPTKGSGGKGRRSLEAKSGTLPAEQRHWYDGKQRHKANNSASRSGGQGGAGAERSPNRPDNSDLLIGRNPVVEALRAGMPPSACSCPTASTRTRASTRRPRWPARRAWTWSR